MKLGWNLSAKSRVPNRSFWERQIFKIDIILGLSYLAKPNLPQPASGTIPYLTSGTLPPGHLPLSGIWHFHTLKFGARTQLNVMCHDLWNLFSANQTNL